MEHILQRLIQLLCIDQRGVEKGYTGPGIMAVDKDTVSNDEEFEKLILAYDYSTRLKSAYEVEDQEPEMIHNGRYTYPGFVFARRKNNAI